MLRDTAAPSIQGAAVVVGRPVNVLLYSGFDLACGDTTVTSINGRTGSFQLANGYKFHADGRGHACNSACYVGPARYPHNDRTLTTAERETQFALFMQDTAA